MVDGQVGGPGARVPEVVAEEHRGDLEHVPAPHQEVEGLTAQKGTFKLVNATQIAVQLFPMNINTIYLQEIAQPPHTLLIASFQGSFFFPEEERP
ncbi:hypothetical protein OS493_028348 [Desmophyllum pertusum]|uniref:Uncharacterized protein n=1 Tax=Desmophyllum pertusum TaxID=174260 RepID=A0A9W9Y978_9CNID|nr:hypothetical protein OS493_028348 [Desmophyllum pertusum]